MTRKYLVILACFTMSTIGLYSTKAQSAACDSCTSMIEFDVIGRIIALHFIEGLENIMKKMLLLIPVVALAGCSKVTNENYKKLKLGMSYEEVNTIIGAPDNCFDVIGTKSCIWGKEDSKHIKVSFIGDNAATFSTKDLN